MVIFVFLQNLCIETLVLHRKFYLSRKEKIYRRVALQILPGFEILLLT